MSLEDTVEKKVDELINDRSLFELWLDKHNHKMELFRSLFGFFNLLISTLIVIKVFEVF